jgi:hypothetical protein
MHGSVELRISPPTFALRMRTDISRLQMVGIQRVFLCIFGLHPTRVPVCCPLACLNLLLLHCAIRYHACVYHGPCPLCPSCVHLSAGCAFRALSAETWPLYPQVRLEPRPSSPLGLDYMTQPPPPPRGGPWPFTRRSLSPLDVLSGGLPLSCVVGTDGHPTFVVLARGGFSLSFPPPGDVLPHSCLAGASTIPLPDAFSWGLDAPVLDAKPLLGTIPHGCASPVCLMPRMSALAINGLGSTPRIMLMICGLHIEPPP